MTLILAMNGCSTSSEIEQCTLKGKIVLDSLFSNLDYSGITVAIYEVKSDTLISRLNSTYPLIGNQEIYNSFFDHRSGKKITSTSTNYDGTFEIKGLKPGVINIVIFKEEYGIRYFLEKNLNKGENNIKNVLGREEVCLKHEAIYSGIYQEGIYNFTKEVNTVITQDVIFMEGTMVDIHPGAIIRIDPGKKIIFYGDLKIVGDVNDPFIFTSNDKIYSINYNDKIEYYDRISIMQTANIEVGKVQYGIFNNCNIGINFSNTINICDCYFFNISNPIIGQGDLLNNDICNIVNCLLDNRNDTDLTMVSINSINKVNIENNIILGGDKGIYLTNIDVSTIINNYLDCYNKSIDLHSEVSANIVNNDIISDVTGINAYNQILLNIKHNNIISNIGMKFNYVNVNAFIENNNIISNDYNIYSTTWGGEDIQAPNNYWGTNIRSEIDAKIIDKNDFTPVSFQYYDYLTYVIYDPYKNQYIIGNGIH